MGRERRVVVVGAGVAGLTAAALLAKAGLDVTVLEAHVDPGGCAATYFYKNYYFDAGATLVGGFQPGGPHDLAAERLDIEWPVHRSDPAMIFHSPDGEVVRWGDPDRWRQERQRAFGSGPERFWKRQEWVADQVWRFAASLPPWPVTSGRDAISLARLAIGQPQLAALAPLLFAKMVHWLNATGASGRLLKQFLDAQLLISAQATTEQAAALFGAVALDLPRAGVFHVKGGVGGIAETLAARVRSLGGRVLYKAEVTAIVLRQGRVSRVVTRKKGEFEADVVVANLTPWNIAALLGESAPLALRTRVSALPPEWGAFMLYLGVDDALVPPEFPLHHQFLQHPDRPLGEGNTVFLSISPAWDGGRAPAGQRAITMSTHTEVAPWWELRDASDGLVGYEARVAEYSERLLAAARQLLPTIDAHIRLQLPGTPVTFERFTRRYRGYVGGFPQHSIWTAQRSRLPVEGMWMVGDSIFPGQSTAGVTLGAMRVADTIVRDLKPRHLPVPAIHLPRKTQERS